MNLLNDTFQIAAVVKSNARTMYMHGLIFYVDLDLLRFKIPEINDLVISPVLCA